MSVEEYKKIFFNNIRRLRNENDLTVMELSKRTGLSLDMLEQLEQNILPQEMTACDAILLAKVLGCETYELFK